MVGVSSEIRNNLEVTIKWYGVSRLQKPQFPSSLEILLVQQLTLLIQVIQIAFATSKVCITASSHPDVFLLSGLVYCIHQLFWENLFLRPVGDVPEILVWENWKSLLERRVRPVKNAIGNKLISLLGYEECHLLIKRCCIWSGE